MFRLSAYTFLIGAGCLLCSLSLPQERRLHKASWLLGTWENTRSGKTNYETWHRENAVMYTAQDYRLNGRDTMVTETIQLIEENDGVFYIPTVRNQNKGAKIRFGLVAFSDTSMLFENAAHDFPKRIEYRKVNPDSIVAEISGNGKQIRFEMTRVR